MLNRTFGCVRVVWNRTLAWRHARYYGGEQAKTNFTQANAVDPGIKDFAVTSGGEKIANPRSLARRERNLARYQRRLSRCQRGSANRAKARAKVARAHRKVRAARTDFLRKAGLAVAGDNPGHACGADVRPQGNPLRRSAVKQEPRPVRAGIPALRAGSSQEHLRILTVSRS